MLRRSPFALTGFQILSRVGLVAGLVAGGVGLRGWAQRRVALEVRRARDDCSAYRATERHEHARVCVDLGYVDQHVGALRTEQQRQLERARVAFETRDETMTRDAIAHVLAASDRLDRDATVISMYAAARAVSVVLDMLDDPRLASISAADRAALFSRVELESSAHPFAAARLQSRWERIGARRHDEGWSPGALVEATNAAADDAILGKMGTAIASGDLPACSAAASELGGPNVLQLVLDRATPATMSWVCLQAAKNAGVAARLERVRAAAKAEASRDAAGSAALQGGGIMSAPRPARLTGDILARALNAMSARGSGNASPLPADLWIIGNQPGVVGRRSAQARDVR